MDTKAQRRNQYETKAYFEEKFDAEYKTSKFPQEVMSLLDDEIPNANLKQLTKFMEKHYKRILKLYPEAQKAINKVITEKLNKLPEEIKQSQIQKIFNHFKTVCPEYEFTEIEPKQFLFGPKDDKYSEKHNFRHYQVEDIFIRFPVNGQINMHIYKRTAKKTGYEYYAFYHFGPQKGPYAHFNLNHGEVKLIASTMELQKSSQYEINTKSNNFQRKAQIQLQLLSAFIDRIDQIEKSKNQEAPL